MNKEADSLNMFLYSSAIFVIVDFRYIIWDVK